jgi:hypothetical protein
MAQQGMKPDYGQSGITVLGLGWCMLLQWIHKIWSNVADYAE